MSIGYLHSLSLSQNLKDFEKNHQQLLLLPLTRKQEQQFRYEALIKKLFFINKIASLNLETKQIFKLLKPLVKHQLSLAERYLLNYKQLLEQIDYHWTNNTQTLTLDWFEQTANLLYRHKYKFDRNKLQNFLRFVQSKTEHQLIQAATVFFLLPDYLISPKEAALPMSILSAYLFLTKGGFNFRQLLVLEVALFQKKIADKAKLPLSAANMSKTLEQFVFELNLLTEALIEKIKDNRYDLHYPSGFFELSSRQQNILALFENPETKVTNRLISHQYKVSQITASRDLSRLASLGLVLSSGKGRGTYYLKI